MTRVVVIEDSRTQAAHLQLSLERHGFHVEVAHEGRSGIELCRLDPPDVVLSDVVMPGMDGFAVARAIKGDPDLAGTLVILMTNLDDPRDVMRAVEAGADNYVTKPYDIDRLVARVRRMLRGESLPGQVDVGDERFVLPRESTRLVDVLASSLEDAVERNRALQTKQEELTRTNMQREELMRVVAHELRSPLQVLAMRATVATQRADDLEFLRKLPAVVERQVRLMVRIIDDLSDVTAIDLGTLKLERDPGVVGTLVEHAVAEVRMQHPDREFALQTEPDLTAPIDASRIQQVVTNLLTNAVKYSPSGTPVTVRARRSEGNVLVEVVDRGMGIAESKAQRIFDRYFRVEEAASQATGVGLGLFICSRIVEMHGGRIGVRSREGEGSTFWFEIPASGSAGQG